MTFSQSLKITFTILLVLSVGYSTFSQDNPDSLQQTTIKYNLADSLQVEDTTHTVETAPLDIGANRGLFIITPDQKMQLRILGSVRYLVDFDNVDLADKNSFQTFEIPTGNQNKWLPNYFNGLNQTRLGFEVTRKTEDGDVFIRLETDFAGINGFRIRHAYGQYQRFLIGQTWSLFSQITALPSTVDFSGPPGSAAARTPQIRYFSPWSVLDMNLAIGLEYVVPDIELPDSIQVKPFQFLPAASARLDHNFDWGYLQISGVLPVLSARNKNDDFIVRVGWGVAASAIVNTWLNGKWYLQIVCGQAINSFVNNLAGTGSNVLITSTGKTILPFTLGLYSTYEHHWTEKVYSNLTYGLVNVAKQDFTPVDEFHLGYAFLLNTFWDIVEGAKIGGEIIWGQRVDKNTSRGDATRINFLFYYDF